MNTVEVRIACKSYGKKSKKFNILNQLTMLVPAGAIYCLIGSSGCGKTTLLSSILGMKRLESGSLKILGQNEASKVCQRVGYMPQETALLDELTVKETIFYFGNIFQMESKRLIERFDMLKRLLELPSDDLRVESCSGGEKRRISFAAAFIHEPDLLILDEPTVGLDPLLRDRIWSFLGDVTRTSDLSVIITTHYIAEAQKSDRIGFMRNGALLAEDSPKNILARLQVETLDEAFLTLCVNNESSVSCDSSVSESMEPILILGADENLKKRSSVRWQIVKELSRKHYKKYLRRPSLLLFTVMFPAVQLFLVYFIFGSNFVLKAGVASSDYTMCFNKSFSQTELKDGICEITKASCLLMDELRSGDLEVEFYDSYSEAFNRMKRGEVIVVLHIKRNFSESFADYLKPQNQQIDPLVVTSANVDFLIDRTLARVSIAAQVKVAQIMNSFHRRLFTACNRSAEFLNSPLAFKTSIYGSSTFNSRIDISPIVMVALCLFISSCLTLTPFLTERTKGLWNRTLLAGVSFSEMLLAQAITFTVIILIINVEFIIFAELVFKTGSSGSYVKLFMLLFVLGWCGMFFGIFLATICTNLTAASSAMFSLTLTMCSVCGILQPHDKMREAFKVFSKFVPYTYPAHAIRNILVKDAEWGHPSVLTGFSITIAWTIVAILMAVGVLKVRKYSSNS